MQDPGKQDHQDNYSSDDKDVRHKLQRKFFVVGIGRHIKPVTHFHYKTEEQKI